jgi:hypothetical protein
MSPSLAVKASGWPFMSAIRFGTPTRLLDVGVGQVAPQTDRVGAVAFAVMVGAGDARAGGGDAGGGGRGEQRGEERGGVVAP